MLCCLFKPDCVQVPVAPLSAVMVRWMRSLCFTAANVTHGGWRRFSPVETRCVGFIHTCHCSKSLTWYSKQLFHSVIPLFSKVLHFWRLSASCTSLQMLESIKITAWPHLSVCQSLQPARKGVRFNSQGYLTSTLTSPSVLHHNSPLSPSSHLYPALLQTPAHFCLFILTMSHRGSFWASLNFSNSNLPSDDQAEQDETTSSVTPT